MVKIPFLASTIPPLTNGDKLTRYEFERRYNTTSKPKKAELIEGIVYIMPAALRFRSHGQPHGRILTWIGNYEVLTPGVALGVEPTVRLDLDNEPQPDAILIIIPEAGGQTRISEDDYIEGAPELVVEIAASSAAIDLHGKKQAYRRNGVKEYIGWQVLDQKLSWFSLEEGEYLELAPNEEGVLQSRVFPGLWLAVNELLIGNMQVVLNVLQAGLQSLEHADFIEKLGDLKSD
jgi:Uma2 family endonuclease